MNTYKIVWQSFLYGESMVEAETPQEAINLAIQGKDTGFEQLDPDGDWEPIEALIIE